MLLRRNESTLGIGLLRISTSQPGLISQSRRTGPRKPACYDPKLMILVPAFLCLNGSAATQIGRIHVMRITWA